MAWVLTVDDLFAGQGFGPRAVAATILAGLAGGDVLLNYVNQTYGTAATQEAGSAVESQAKAVDNVTEELKRSREENRQLRRENERLRKRT